MERKKGKGIAAICIVVMAVICAYNGVSYFQKKQCADNPYKAYAAKEKSRKAGSFEYTYRTSAEGVWITKIRWRYFRIKNSFKTGREKGGPAGKRQW